MNKSNRLEEINSLIKNFDHGGQGEIYDLLLEQHELQYGIDYDITSVPPNFQKLNSCLLQLANYKVALTRLKVLQDVSLRSRKETHDKIYGLRADILKENQNLRVYQESVRVAERNLSGTEEELVEILDVLSPGSESEEFNEIEALNEFA